MILIDNKEVTFKEIDDLISFFHQNAFTTSEKKSAVIIEEYLRDCRELDIKLQNEVASKISRNLISIIKIPFDEVDDFSTLELLLMSKNNEEVKKRENLLFNQISKKYLRNFRGLIDRAEG